MAQAQLKDENVLEVMEDGELTQSELEDCLDDPEVPIKTGTGETIDRLFVAPATRARITRYFEQDKAAGICQLKGCTYTAPNDAAFYKHVEAHNLIYVCKCAYYSSIRDTTTRHVRKAHPNEQVIITQVDRRNWEELRKHIQGLPRHSPRMPAHSSTAFRPVTAQGCVKATTITDIRYMSTKPSSKGGATAVPKLSPRKTGAKRHSAYIPKKEMSAISRSAKPSTNPTTFSIVKVPASVPASYKIPKKEKTDQLPRRTITQQPNWRRGEQHSGSITTEINRREERTTRLRHILREEEEEILRLRQLRDRM